MGWIGPAIAAGASILGGVLSDRAAGDRQAQELAAQRQFAQQGIRWRVEDAKAAGIHPIYALGASIPTYSPSAYAGGGLGRGLAQAGQDIGRAVQAKQTADERNLKRLSDLDVAKSETELALMRAQLAKERAQLPPPMPTATVKPVDVEVVPDIRTPMLDPKPGSGIDITLPGGAKVRSTADRTSEQTVEDIYGGVMGELFGTSWAVHDVMRTLRVKYGLPLWKAKELTKIWLRNRKMTRAQERVYYNLYDHLQRR